jgi:hypothetical protein
MLGGGGTRISFIVKACELSSSLFLSELISSLTLMSPVYTPSVMQRTYSSPPIATFLIARPESI